jgi:hypothetical protein
LLDILLWFQRQVHGVRQVRACVNHRSGASLRQDFFASRLIASPDFTIDAHQTKLVVAKSKLILLIKEEPCNLPLPGVTKNASAPVIGTPVWAFVAFN